MRALVAGMLVALAMAVVASGATAATKSSAVEPDSGKYIVVLKDSVERPGLVAQDQVEERDGQVKAVYKHALEGYAAVLPKDEVEALRKDPRVAFITVDHQVQLLQEVELETENNEGIEPSEATIPTGIARSLAAANKTLKIDGEDNVRVNADVAVLDTGIDHAHPDLDVEGRTNCVTGTCVDNTGADGHSHGTHVAGTIGALDNSQGVVGVAPGARLWAVKVLSDGGSGSESAVMAGVDWVTAHAKDIEVANMSLGCFCTMSALDKAITKSVEAGIVYSIAAGNSNADAKNFSPANNANVITVSALTDYDGKPGAKGSVTCTNWGLDDRKAGFSNYGTSIEVAAPGVCILSTTPGNKYGFKSGTSMAAPHVAGAAAILASTDNPASKGDAEAIRDTIENEGNFEWTDTSSDGVKEPLLDVSDETVFRPQEPPVVTTQAATDVKAGSARLTGTVDPKGADAEYTFEYGETTSYGTKVGPVTLLGAFAPKKSTSTVANDASVGETAWTNPSNAKASDNVYSHAGYGWSNRLKATNFGFSLPADAIPVGVTARIEFRAEGSDEMGSWGDSVRLLLDGAPAGEGKSTGSSELPYGGDTYLTYGAGDDNWGLALTRADIEDPDFGIAFAVRNEYGGLVDHVEVTVHYIRGTVSVDQMITNLKAGTTYHYRLAASNIGGTSFGADQTFTTQKVPTVTTDSATGVKATSATLGGQVNPEGFATSYYFQWGPTTSYGRMVPIQAKEVGSGTSAVAVDQAITGLKPGATYHYRVVASSTTGTSFGQDKSVTTGQEAPTATTKAATGVKDSTATLEGSVDPKSLNTQYYFEYGQSEGYGTKMSTTEITGRVESQKSTSTVANDASVGETAWTNPSNAKASDNVYSHAGYGWSNRLKATNFGFSLPADAIPVGVTARIEFRAEGSDEMGSWGDSVRLLLDGAPAGEGKSTGSSELPYGGDTYLTYGAGDDNWGLALTRADIEDPDFGVAFAVRNEYGGLVDHVEVTVHYIRGTAAVSAPVSGLKASTTYHYRLVGTNAGGTSYGTDQTFTTEAATIPSQLAGMSVTEPFNGTTSGTSNFATDWSALGWASGSPAKGENTSSGWRPVGAFPTVNGAYFAPTFTDAGSGLATMATMATNPSLTERYFSLWLDMSTPSSTRAGYELRFTKAASGYDVTLSNWQSGSKTPLASQAGVAFANGNTFALVDQGGTVSAWIDTGSGFTQLLSASDSAFSGGKAAIEGSGNITRLTNFKIAAF